jgi:predicted aspartyl protease
MLRPTSPYFAYTYSIPKDQNNAIIIPVEVGVSLPIPGVPPSKKAKINVRALIDTGASGSCISKRFADNFQLKAFSMGKVHTAKGEDVRPRYYVDIYLPNGLMKRNMDVIEFSDNPGSSFDFIIGMNIIKDGDMSITNANSQMVFSFRMPPNYLHIDYEKILRKDKAGKLQKDDLRKYQTE